MSEIPGLKAAAVQLDEWRRADGSVGTRDGLILPGAPQATTRSGDSLRKRVYRGTALDSLPNPEALIPELLTRDSLAVIYGPPGSGKTFLAMSMALAVVTGRPWFGHQVHQGAVLYIAAEGVRGIKTRQRAWLMHHNVPDNAVDDMIWLGRGIDLSNSRHVEELAGLADESGVVWIIIDTLNRNSNGLDENSSRDMGLVIAALDRLRASGEQPCVTVLHHSGKDVSRGARGHTSLLGAMDTELAVTSRGSGLIELKVTKQKDGEEVGPLTYGLERVADSAVVVPTIADAVKDRDLEVLEALDRIVDDEARGAPGGAWEEAAGEVGIKSTSFKEARKRLVGRGLVRSAEGGGRYPPYMLTEQGKSGLRSPKSAEGG